MKIKKDTRAKTDIIYRVLKQLLMRIETLKAEDRGEVLNWPPECHDVDNVVWLLGFTPDENRQLNWILNGDEEVITQSVSFQ